MRHQASIIVAILLLLALVKTWHWVLKRKFWQEDKRQRISSIGLILCSASLIVQIVVGALAYNGKIATLDKASLNSTWHMLGAWFLLISFFVSGILSIIGLLFAAAGNGKLRMIVAGWSVTTGLIFCVNLVLAINAFH